MVASFLVFLQIWRLRNLNIESRGGLILDCKSFPFIGLLTQRLAPGRAPSAVYDNQVLLRHLVQDKRSPQMDPNVGKRSGQSYMELSCDGAYDRQLFSRLERVCDDCYNLYKEPQVHGMCR